MSAAAIAAMAVAVQEEQRRRNDPDYQSFCSVGDLMDCSWAGPILLIIAILFSAVMIYMSIT